MRLLSNTTGGFDTAIGSVALFSNTTGSDNTATGSGALLNNTTGHDNTANGGDALGSNTTASNNTANGAFTLSANTTGSDNTATGSAALQFNQTGHNNTATGETALLNNLTGFDNTANGAGALQNNTTGSSNIAVGNRAGASLTTGSNNIDIGNVGVALEANTIRIGTHAVQMATYIAGICNVTLPNGIPVVVDCPTGQLGVSPSSRRFKTDIKPMNQISEAILALKPVTFHYQSDAKNTPCFGLIAEEVAAVNSNLVVRDKEGKPYSVRYDQVNAMLLNEFLKEHHQVQDLKATVAEQQKQIEVLTAGLQKVSAQLEVSKPAPQTVLNNH